MVCVTPDYTRLQDAFSSASRLNPFEKGIAPHGPGPPALGEGHRCGFYDRGYRSGPSKAWLKRKEPGERGGVA